MEDSIKRIGLLIVILGLISITSIFVAIVLRLGGTSPLAGGNVAVIPIVGVISAEPDSWSQSVDPAQVRDWLDEADSDDGIKAVVLEIDSPGGSPVASDEIGQALKRMHKPTVAWIREVGASGGYWIASNTDYIIANRMSITGSVGVTASYLDFAGTLRRYNASYQQLISGERKELGSPWIDLNESDRALLQKKIDTIHSFFIDEVRQNRNLSDEQLKQVSTGEFFLGSEALQLHLVDELGSFEQVESYLNQTLGEEPSFRRYEKPRSFLQDLADLKASFFPSTQSGVAIRT